MLKHRRSRLGAMPAAVMAASIAATLHASDLARQFQSPPPEARPWVYWFWLNGNITREGITADLEAMQRVGIGGVLIMEVDQGAPVGPIPFAGTAWRELFAHAVAEAGRLGLEINMNNDAGWNGSGGPWIRPEESMQKLVWTETDVTGPGPFQGTLPRPEAVAGYYRDIAVLAFPAPGSYRIENIRVKACFETGGAGAPARDRIPAEMEIARDRIVDLTRMMRPDGRLDWVVPDGAWTILRMGHTSTGVMNAPAPESGRGLECDKLGKAGIEANFAGLMAKLIADAGPAAGRALIATHIDSWENGAQNWTIEMPAEFRRRRGYDIIPWLPVVTGRVISSLELSERFLWDLRQSISDLVVENYAGHLRTLAQQHGLRLSIEAYGGPCDDLPYAGRADEPMCEFWVGGALNGTCKEMASAAHTYGKPILGAEAFTATDAERWRDHPATLKALGDEAFCAGVNRFVFHRYAMQPWLDRRPGMTMGPWGVHYERTQTWWEETQPWHTYLARCQFLLSQGLFVADLCYLQPESAPQGFHGHAATPYDFDNCSAEVVLTRMRVRDGRLVLPDGMSYRALVLPETPAMTPELLARLKALAEAGATIIGAPPAYSPSLNDYPHCDERVRQLARELWGDCDGVRVTERAVGRGRIVRGVPPEKVLQQAGIPPDFASRARLHYIHRSAGDTDIYFVANPAPSDVQAVCSFRVTGKRPELWHPETGTIAPAALFRDTGTTTDLPLRLGPSESVFVIFRADALPAAPPIELVTRDDKPVLASVMPPPEIVVGRALYGVLDDPGRTRDVRDAVQQIVNAGDTAFAVTRLAESGDPAPNVRKTAAVEYRIGERPGSVTAQDGELLSLTTDTRAFAVQRAIYGVLDDPARTRDVRARVQRLLDAGERSFVVARMAEGDDPAFLVVKTLVLDYTVDGEARSVTGRDTDMIRLTPYRHAERIVEARSGPDGTRYLELWQPGQFEAHTAGGARARFEIASLPEPLEIAGPWEVAFAPGWGAPERARFETLVSWPEHPDPGIRRYSGAATYGTTFTVPPGMLAPDRRIYLDLGAVEVMARPSLNGRDLGLLWKPPYRADVTDSLKPGTNALEVRVVSLWPNRMIGDEHLPEDSDRTEHGTLRNWPQWLDEGKPSPTGRFTFTSWRLWRRGDAPLPSGLIGPVRLEVSIVREVDGASDRSPATE